MKIKNFLIWPCALILLFVATRSFKEQKEIKLIKQAVRKPAQASANPSIKNNEKKIPEISLIEEIKTLAECDEKDCGSSNEDPRTDYYNRGQNLKKKINQYEYYVTQNRLQNPEISELALKLLGHSDGHVQEAALDLLSTQPISKESLDTILEKIIKGIDAELIHQALLELQRYTSFDDQEKIRLTLGEALMKGAPFVALAIAEKINLILNSQNISYFENLLSQMDPQSLVFKNLKYSVQEYDQLSQAG